MEYRSEVALAARGPVLEKILRLGAEDPEVTELLSCCDEIGVDCSEEKAVLFRWDWVKWYEHEYASVAKLMSCLDGIDAAGDWDPESLEWYRFIRVGEDIADVELRGEWYNDPFELGVSVSIHVVNSSGEGFVNNSGKCLDINIKTIQKQCQELLARELK